ncbi:hypothetical protein YenMTG1_074 [Yersinia phage vB_YenM_TG1]|uniref:Uncharacterized protein n=1 Tax=Yersinia phage vB_YenM_TG1 TaxID=1589265 RepID=A0A0B4ZZA8_9CAUD|nr:hypothetical protein AVV33_gp074 [Yersinia phage vB_YenM_TG1]AJD81883.1 hypothetical protein YenMTG1_074 [Yersinia phage vB_YenM_TG1]
MKNLARDLALIGYIVKSTSDDRLLIESHSNRTQWAIEEDFGVWWLYQFDSRREIYFTVDTFSLLDDALQAAKDLS